MTQEMSTGAAFDRLAQSADGGLLPISGGIPATGPQGSVVAYIGVSGSHSSADDALVARAAAAVLASGFATPSLDFSGVTPVNPTPALPLSVAWQRAQVALSTANAATYNNIGFSVCVCDEGANPILTLVADGALPVTVDLSARKAETSVLLNISTRALHDQYMQPTQAGYTIDNSNAQRLTGVAGGYPLLDTTVRAFCFVFCSFLISCIPCS